MKILRPLRSLIFAIFLISTACQVSVSNLPQPVSSAASSGKILFQDDFSNPVSGWDRQKLAEGVMDYDAGGYRMLINALNSNFWAAPHKDFTDVRIEVDEGKLGGPDENRVGLICRYSGSDYYFFMITHDGFYGIGIYSQKKAALLGQSQMQFSPAIHASVNINHLRADCVGDTLTLYVNGQQITQVHDPTLKHGDVGLLAGTFTQPGVDIFFDNFVVIQP